jgi:hypothetical protein
MSGINRQRRHRLPAAYLAGLVILLAVPPPPVLHPQSGSHFDYLGEQHRLINNFYEKIRPTCRTGAEIDAAWEIHVERPLRALDPRRLSDVKAIYRQANAPISWTSGRSPSDLGFRAGGDFDTSFQSQASYHRAIGILEESNIPHHNNGNSFTAPSLNWTGHMPSPSYNESLTERPWVRDAMAADPEAASHYGLRDRATAIPFYEATSGRMLVVDNPIPKNPFTPLGDLAKKNQEALAMINKPGATMADVHEAANFASKAPGKAYDVMRQSNLTKFIKPVERMSDAQIANRLGRPDLSLEEAKTVVKEMVSQAGKQLTQYSNLAVRDIGQTVRKLEVEWVRAMERGDSMAAARAKTQLMEIRSSMREAASRLRNESAYRAVFGRDDSLTLGRPVSPDAKVGPVKPQMTTMQNILDKGMKGLQLALALRAVYEGTGREIEDARKAGREVNPGLVVIKSLDDFLGISRAWETGRMAGEQTMAKYLEQAIREGRDLTLLEKLKAKLESLLSAFGEFSNINAFGRSIDEARQLVEASIAEVDAKLREHREWLRQQEIREGKSAPVKPGSSGVPSLIADSKAKESKIEAKMPETEMDKTSKWSTVEVSDVVVSPRTVGRGEKVGITARIAGVRVASMADLDLSCFIDGHIVDHRYEQGKPGGFDFFYQASYEVPEGAVSKTYQVQVVAGFKTAAEIIEREAREAAVGSGKGSFVVEESIRVMWTKTLRGEIRVDKVYPYHEGASTSITKPVCDWLDIGYFPFGVPSQYPGDNPRGVKFSGRPSFHFTIYGDKSEHRIEFSETYVDPSDDKTKTEKRWVTEDCGNKELPWNGRKLSFDYEGDRKLNDGECRYHVEGTLSADMSQGSGKIVFYSVSYRTGAIRKLAEGTWKVKFIGEDFVEGELAERLLKMKKK